MFFFVPLDGDDLSLDKESLTLLVVRLPGGESEVGFALQGSVCACVHVQSNVSKSANNYVLPYSGKFSLV